MHVKSTKQSIVRYLLEQKIKCKIVFLQNLEDQICAEINLDRMRTMKKLDTLRSQSKFSQRQRPFQFNNNNNNRPTLRDLL